jgi:pimeloyl-ACP methyl ester carboxylesterase
VHELGLSADVFAFCYSQNAEVETIARAPGLALAVQKLRFLGYREIILIGHSAGGLLARLFVEDNPSAGVTRVVQVCAPNLGSSWGQADISVHNVQEKFIESLTPSYRRTASAQRAQRRIPPGIDFVCVVGGGPLGDGLVSPASQWPDDLQAQGIPMTHLNTTHFTVMHSRKIAPVFAELARTSQPRWTAQQVETARGQYLHPAPKLRILPIKK